MNKIFFFLGKGGVGKTTLSASLAYYLREKNKTVYWASIDPAHNIYDLLSLPASPKVQKIEAGLWVEEIDVDRYLRRFLEHIQEKAQKVYQYLQILNLDKMFKVIKYTPAMEEYACLYALKEVFKKHEDKDYLIIDTPPTGLMLRIFSLPFVTELWLKELRHWREEILKRRQIVAHIKHVDFGPGAQLEFSKDKVFNELNAQQKDMQYLKDVFTNPKKTFLILVINPDKLSLLEGKRIVETLNKFGIPIKIVLLNKTGHSMELKELNFFNDLPQKKIPLFEGPFPKQVLLKIASLWVEDAYL